MSIENKRHFRKGNKCHIFNELYSRKDIRVRDYFQITGEYRDSAYQTCNATFQLTKKDLHQINSSQNNQKLYQKLKFVSAIFYQMFIFSSSDRPSKTMKNVFHFILKALFVLEIFKSL